MNDLISSKEAAVELGVSQRRVEALITAGRLSAVKIGGSYVIRRSSLEGVRHRKPGRPQRLVGSKQS